MSSFRSLVSLPTIALLVMVLSLLLVRIGAITPIVSFGLFMVAWLAGGLGSIVAGGWNLWRGESRSRATWQLVAGLLLLAAIAIQGRSRQVPAIHDITTNTADPPAFTAAASLPGNLGRNLSYPHGGTDVPRLQAAGYPDLVPIELAQPPVAATAAVMDTIDRLGWTMTFANAQLGTVEATDVTSLFRFVDDIVVRVRASEAGSVVDVRSLSRVGRSDLGANAARIRAFRDLLQASTE